MRPYTKLSNEEELSATIASDPPLLMLTMTINQLLLYIWIGRGSFDTIVCCLLSTHEFMKEVGRNFSLSSPTSSVEFLIPFSFFN